MQRENQYSEDSYSWVSTSDREPPSPNTSYAQACTTMPNIRGDLQNVINVLCNKVSIFAVIWSSLTFTVIGTVALKAADQSAD